MSLAVALLVGSTVAWAALEARATPREPHAHLPRELATGLTLLAIHGTAIAEHAVVGGPGPAIALAGGLAIAAGIALRLWAIRALGGRFVSPAVAPDRRIAAGPYRWLRHPSEVGLVLAAGGAAALLGSALALAITLLVLAPLSVVRCAAEDHVLG